MAHMKHIAKWHEKMKTYSKVTDVQKNENLQ